MATPTITLANKTRRMLTLHLPEVGTKVHTIGMQERSKTAAARGWKEVVKELPISVTLQPQGDEGDSLDGLPEAVECSPEVVSAVKRGHLKVTRVEPPAAPPPAPPQPEPVPEAPVTKTTKAALAAAKE